MFDEFHLTLIFIADPQWRRRYWMFLAYFVAALTFVHVFLTPISNTETYNDFLGYVGLAIEAVLPLPQVIANHKSRSCKGFRLSVCAAWILGDTMKLSYFFFGPQVIPWAFRLCAMFQCACDSYLGFQFWMYSRPQFRVATTNSSSSPAEHESWGHDEKDIRMN